MVVRYTYFEPTNVWLRLFSKFFDIIAFLNSLLVRSGPCSAGSTTLQTLLSFCLSTSWFYLLFHHLCEAMAVSSHKDFSRRPRSSEKQDYFSVLSFPSYNLRLKYKIMHCISLRCRFRPYSLHRRCSASYELQIMKEPCEILTEHVRALGRTKDFWYT